MSNDDCTNTISEGGHAACDDIATDKCSARTALLGAIFGIPDISQLMADAQAEAERADVDDGTGTAQLAEVNAIRDAGGVLAARVGMDPPGDPG